MIFYLLAMSKIPLPHVPDSVFVEIISEFFQMMNDRSTEKIGVFQERALKRIKDEYGVDATLDQMYVRTQAALDAKFAEDQGGQHV